MTAIPYWHVDAFASKAFGGNQAAVMILQEWLADDVLLAIAAENMFAETAFLVPDAGDGADYELRWFTPDVEVDLCGHATLASGHVILSHQPARNEVSFRTRKAGILHVTRDGDGMAYQLALPAITVEDEAAPELIEGLGGTPLEAVSNDRGYVIARYQDEAAVRALDPDMAALAAHGNVLFICTAPGEIRDVVSRVFVPGAGIPEDSVTGSAHAALTVFWAERMECQSFTAYQASRRGGDLTCLLDGDRAILGGDCVTVVEGSFYLSG